MRPYLGLSSEVESAEQGELVLSAEQGELVQSAEQGELVPEDLETLQWSVLEVQVVEVEEL